MPSIALASCSALPAGDEDAPALLAALADRGITAETPDWRDADVSWDRYQLVVLRSTWDYTRHLADFLAWTDRLGERLLNPAAVVRWNCDKTYLRDLGADGVPVTPTVWVAPGERADLPEVEFVVKPTVGAGARGAGRFAPDATDAAGAHLRDLHAAGRTAMVQPYLSAVDEEGETALVFVAGAFSHAVRKNALLGAGVAHTLDSPPGRPALWVEETMSARTPTEAQLAVGRQVLAGLERRFAGPLLYTRVDLLPGAEGPVVVEVEAVEPSLFLGLAPGAADRLAAAIAGRIAP